MGDAYHHSDDDHGDRAGRPEARSSIASRPKPGSSISLNLALGVLRCAFSALFLTSFFWGLAFLGFAERAGVGSLQPDSSTVDRAFHVAFWCFGPFLCLALLVERLVETAQRVRFSWNAVQTMICSIVAVVCGLFAWYLFDPDRFASKEIMLVFGAALGGFLASGMQLAFRQPSAASPDRDADFPFAWYLALTLLGATFFGAMSGWVNASPELRMLLEYQQSRWVGRADLPPLPAPDPDFPADRGYH